MLNLSHFTAGLVLLQVSHETAILESSAHGLCYLQLYGERSFDLIDLGFLNVHIINRHILQYFSADCKIIEKKPRCQLKPNHF